MILTVRDFWLKVGPIVGQIALDVKRPNTFQNIESLFNEIQKLDTLKELETLKFRIPFQVDRLSQDTVSELHHRPTTPDREEQFLRI